MIALSFVPPALAGYALERQIERRLGGPRRDRRRARRRARWRWSPPTAPPGARAAATPAPLDGLALGVAQAAALAPGVSRNGATLTAARRRRFTPRAREPALAHRRAAGDRRRRRVLKGVAPAPPRVSSRSSRRAIAAGVARLVRLHPRLAAPDRAGRARPRAVALRRLPARARRRGRGQNEPVSERAADAYAAAGVSQRDADDAVAALVAQPVADRDRQALAGRRPARATTPACCGSTSAPGSPSATDGVGTKMVVAERLGRFDTIGIDCVAMNVNDLICVGAEPIAMLDFILCRGGRPRGLRRDRRGAAPRRRARRDRDPGRRDRPGRRRRLGLGARRQRDRARRPRRDRRPARGSSPATR